MAAQCRHLYLISQLYLQALHPQAPHTSLPMELSLFCLTILSRKPFLILPDDSNCSFSGDPNKLKTLPLKLAAIFSILFCGAIGVCLPIAGKWLPALSPEKDIFLHIKAFAAGVILATGFVHILPDGFDSLSSPSLPASPWGDFPFAGFIAMLAAIGTLMVDNIATTYYTKEHFNKPVDRDGERSSVEYEEQPLVHTHATHGRAQGSSADHESGGSNVIRQRVISQVLEFGIVVHSIIIGISLGVAESSSAIRPLVAALSFHQFFEGMGLGGCIIQAKFKACSMATMIIFFSLTTPLGIAIGVGISSVYHKNSPTALIVEGVLNSSSAGILIYMALVDLLAADFRNPRVKNSGKLQLGIILSTLIGAGLMSLLAQWA